MYKKQWIFLICAVLLFGVVFALCIDKWISKSSTVSNAGSESRVIYYIKDIDIGMSELDVLDEWGYPEKRETTKTENHDYDTYIYIDYNGDYYFVHFEDGAVYSVADY